MQFKAATLDDLLMLVLQKLVRQKSIVAATRGDSVELAGVLLKLSNPRARLSHTEKRGKVFSALGELLWYLAKSRDLSFIKYYLNRYADESEDGKTLYGAYGPRLFGQRECNQIQNVLDLLRKKPASRRGVIQLFNAEDIASDHKEIPCTCTLQFLLRQGRLHLITYMRSNDAYVGLPHDIFAFTMMQEIVARSLDCSLGSYTHVVGSLHLYKCNIAGAQQYLDEGWQPQKSASMPPMPPGDPWLSVKQLLKAERRIRRGEDCDLDGLGLDNYWRDLGRLLLIWRHWKFKDGRSITRLRKQMNSRVFDAFITRRVAKPQSASDSPQLVLPFPTPKSATKEEGAS